MEKLYYGATSVALVLLAMFSNSCSKTNLESDEIVSGPKQSVANVSAAPCSTLKQRPLGMTWRDGLPPTNLNPNNENVVGNAIFQLTWKNLQPTVYFAGGGINQAASSAASNIQWNLIDQAITDWTAAGYPGVPLRLYSGVDAPDWAKALGKNEANAGEPTIMSIWVNPEHSGDSIKTSTRYWTQEYIDAHDVLVNRIANRYEGNPKLIAFYAFGFGSAFSEYCINGIFDNLNVYKRNGMTNGKMKTAIQHFLDKYNTSFPTTHIVLWHSLPGFQGCTDGTGGTTLTNPIKPYSDVQFVTDMINKFRGFGKHAINGSNDLDSEEMTSSSELTRIKNAGGPIGHQTRAMSRLTNVYQTCLDGVSSLGGSAVFIELPSGNNLTVAQLRTLNNKAKNNNSLHACP